MAHTDRTLRIERELRAAVAGIADRQVADLVRAWAAAWDEVAPDLNQVLLDMLTTADGASISRAQLMRSKRLQAALAVIAEHLDDLARQTHITITGRLRDVIDTAGAAQASIIDSQLPPASDLVDLDIWSRVDPRQIDAMVRRSTQRITAASKPLAPRATEAVRRELVRGIAAGSNPRVTARRIVQRAEREFNGGLARAMTIARTETIDAYRAAAAVAQEQHADVLQGWEWVASLSKRTCPACLGKHGSVHPLSEPGPLGHQNCRCTRMPVVKSWSDLGFKGITEPKSVIPDADAFFKRLSPFEQQQILGRGGYQAWVAGKFPRSAWATRRTNPGWRDSFVPAKPPKVPRLPSSPPAGPRPKPGDVGKPSGAGFDQRLVGDGAPPMGRVVGTSAQQQYTKASRFPAQRPTPRAFQDSAEYWHTYVADPEDRTTAMLQYQAEFEQLVKRRARTMAEGRPIAVGDDARIKSLSRALPHLPGAGVDAQTKNYELADLRADIEGAAYRLLARRTTTTNVGTVYKGIGLDGSWNLAEPSGVRQAVEAVKTNDWWFTSASNDAHYATGYAIRTGKLPVLLRILDAEGITLDSMGRMASVHEVLLTGGIDVADYTLVNGILVIEGKWRSA